MDLSQAEGVIRRMDHLSDLRMRNTARDEEPDAWYNLWGWFERQDQKGMRI